MNTQKKARSLYWDIVKGWGIIAIVLGHTGYFAGAFEGVIRYGEIVKWMKQHKPDIVVVREEMNPETAQKDIAYMRKLWME